MNWHEIKFSEKFLKTVVLISGGIGALNITDGVISKSKNNFLIRNLDKFTNVNVVVVDFFPECPSIDQRLSSSIKFKFDEILTQICYKYKNIILIGNSAGTVSVLASNFDKPTILIAPVFVNSERTKNENKCLIVHNTNDICEKSNFKYFQKFVDELQCSHSQLDIKLFTSTVTNNLECQAISPHGFWGIDDEVMREINKFINDI